MLLSRLGVYVTQEHVADLAEVTQSIELYGMRIDQLALAVERAAPEARFWYKDHATLEELATLVTQYRTPVGVEWQGVFEGDEEEEDVGHYSIVTRIYKRRKQIRILDPYQDYIAQDRTFSFDEFVPRWWDVNPVTNPVTGEVRLVEDYHMMFAVTPADATFPQLVGMRQIE